MAGEDCIERHLINEKTEKIGQPWTEACTYEEEWCFLGFCMTVTRRGLKTCQRQKFERKWAVKDNCQPCASWTFPDPETGEEDACGECGAA